jgi:hypothetical protein
MALPTGQMKKTKDPLEEAIIGTWRVSRESLGALRNINMNIGKLLEHQLKTAEQQKDLLDRLSRDNALKDPVESKANNSTSVRNSSEDIKSTGNLGFLFGTALLIEALDLDAWMKAIRLPQTIKTIKDFIKSIVKFGDGFSDVLKSIRAFDFGRLFPKITIDVETPKWITDIKTSVKAFGENLNTKLQNLIPETPKWVTNVKTSVTAFGENLDTKVKSLIPETPKTPKWVTDVKTSVTAFGTKIANFIKSIKIEMPDILKDIKIPGLSSLKQFLFGAETAVDGAKATGGIFSIFRGLAGIADTLIGPLKPLLKIFKLGARSIPVVGQLISLFDFIGGFMKGFAGEDEFDEDGELVKKASDRSFMKTIGEGIEGGLLGVIKGITEGIDLLLKEVPVWILKQLGFKKTAEQLDAFWEKNGGLTSFIEPIWNWIKDIPKMLMDLIPSAEDIRNFVMNNIVSLPGGETLLTMMGADASLVAAAGAVAATDDAAAAVAKAKAGLVKATKAAEGHDNKKGIENAQKRLDRAEQNLAKRRLEEAKFFATPPVTGEKLNAPGTNGSHPMNGSVVQQNNKGGDNIYHGPVYNGPTHYTIKGGGTFVPAGPGINPQGGMGLI